KQYGEDQDIVVVIDRKDGSISGTHNGVPLDPEETVGRIGAQTAKQVMIQKIREAERDALHDEYHELIGQMVTGVVQRYERGPVAARSNGSIAWAPASAYAATASRTSWMNCPESASILCAGATTCRC